MIENSRRQV